VRLPRTDVSRYRYKPSKGDDGGGRAFLVFWCVGVLAIKAVNTDDRRGADYRVCVRLTTLPSGSLMWATR
jgi:hypothetical protein